MQPMSSKTPSKHLDLATLNEICNWLKYRLNPCQQYANPSDISAIIDSVIRLTLHDNQGKTALKNREDLIRLQEDLILALQNPAIMSPQIKSPDDATEAIKFLTILCNKIIPRPTEEAEIIFSQAIEEYTKNDGRRKSGKSGFRGSLSGVARILFYRGESQPAAAQRRDTVVAPPATATPAPLDLAGIAAYPTASPPTNLNSPGTERETYHVNIISSDPKVRVKFINDMSAIAWQNPHNERVARNNPMRILGKPLTLRLWDDVNNSRAITDFFPRA